MEERVSFSKFIKELSKKKFVMLGEIHGTKEIPKLIEKLLLALAKYKQINLFLEVPINQQRYLNRKILPFYKYHENSDGRNSKEYLNLIKTLQKFRNRIKLFCIDPLIWDKTRDYKMYKNIIKVQKKSKFLGVFVAGNFHTSFKSFKKLKPTGYYLKKAFKKEIVSVNFVPLSGKLFNLGLKEVPKNKTKARIVKVNGNQYNCHLKKVSPCSFIRN